MDIHALISANLESWMAANPNLNTVKKVAEAAQIGFGTVRRAKNGEGNITVKNLVELAAAFKRPPADLLAERADAVVYTTTLRQESAKVQEAPAKYRTARQERIDNIIELLNTIDDYGVVAMLEKAKDIAKDYPITAKTAS